MVEVEDTEDDDDPGSVGESNGCAVRDSCELVRIRFPWDRAMETAGCRLLRFDSGFMSVVLYRNNRRRNVGYGQAGHFQRVSSRSN